MRFRLAPLALLVACGSETVVQDGLTGVEIIVRHDAALEIDQLLFTCRDVATGERLLAPTARPETPRSLGGGESSVVIVLSEETGGVRAIARADGLVQGETVATAFDQVDLEAKRIVEVRLTLAALIACGDGIITSIAEACDDENDIPGDGCDQTCSVEPGFTCRGEPSLCNQCGNDTCDAGENGCTCPDDCTGGPTCFAGQRCVGNACICDDISCPAGCCSGVNCVGSDLATCGVDGNVCSDCSVVGNACTAAGTCDCGTNPPCDPGGHCVVDTCVCDNVGCAAGCCDNDTCTPPSVSACGIGGSVCQACDPTRADACLAGLCRCGLGNGCTSGQVCTSGNCACDATSCPSGCCAGNTCTTPGFTACGTSGAACVACDAASADNCDAGFCACGADPACNAGQRCLGGSCVCDSVSCPDGCCTSGVCETASASTCGDQGSACIDCGLVADTCTAGSCQCGSGAACASGQQCVGGACQCTAASCPDGCCDGDTCRPASLSTCGAGGGSCTTCNAVTSDYCDNGVCKCGSNDECVSGDEVCQGGTCETACTDCANGCCSNPTTCVDPPTTDTCGTGGVACVDCDADGLADACTSGECTCNGGPACQPGQHCASGCVCDITSCPTGCCDGSGLCVDPTSSGQCGTDGATCNDCGLIADTCTAGSCRCGSGAACASGQECVGGVCRCTAASCPTGCCAGDVDGVCTTEPSVTACGTNGNACVACAANRADSCFDGACQCGGSSECSVGTRCETGACTCDPATCTGCCDGAFCRSSSFASCGTGGVTCVACDTAVADDCIAGACTCGGSPACASDEACSAGVCVPFCDSSTCPSGCCSGTTCEPGTDTNACGAGGAACIACDSLTADICTAGACKCGSLPACTGGEICENSQCVSPPCDTTTCATGCCDTNDQCRAGDHKFWCGTGANDCVDCIAQGYSGCDAQTQTCQ